MFIKKITKLNILETSEHSLIKFDIKFPFVGWIEQIMFSKQKEIWKGTMLFWVAF